MAGSPGYSDYTMYDICYFLLIHYRNYCKQMAESECLGLQQCSVSALWTDLSAFHGFVRISLYDRYLFGWISAASSLLIIETADPDLVMSKEKKSKFSFFCPENSDIM